MTVIPHANWRGIFETVTFANGGIQFCGSGCINAYEIPFTGLNVSGWLEPLHTTTPKHWVGSLRPASATRQACSTAATAVLGG